MPMTDASSPYSTGGGGVWLEHRYAATLVAALLTENPISELGDDVVPCAVRLQASHLSPIDDVVVEGHTRDAHVRRVSIGVRRDPDLTTSDEKSVPLVRSFLRVVTEHWDEVTAGRWRVALAVGVASTAVQQTDALARIARSVPSAAEFRTAVHRPGATNAAVRARLKHLDALADAAAQGDEALSTVATDELTWRWLMALRVRQMRLEGADESDRNTAVSALRRIVAAEATQTADDVFAHLAERSGAWASSAAFLEQTLVRRELSGFPLGRTPSYRAAWSVLDGMERRLRKGTPPHLQAGDVRLELERSEERDRLADAMNRAGNSGSGLVVTGEPDVGKSALTIRTADQLTSHSAAVACLSLRDLPDSAAQLEHLLDGRPLTDVLAAGETRTVHLLVIDGAEAVLEGRRDLMREVAAAAFTAGLGLVAVTRSDASNRVQEVLQAAAIQAGRPETVAQHTVPRLTLAERRRLVETFRTLIRFSASAEAEWLVGRPGLVDVLLRSGTVTETSTLLSEADVFGAVWNGLVRKNEECLPGGVSPDDREQAVLAVARRALQLPHSAPPSGGALPQLRSDAVLRAPANPAFATGDEFATDLMRDFALCRLFLTAGWEPLTKARAPRWAIRAVRLACQAKLMAEDQATTWRELRLEFDQFGEEEGRRWTEVPMEALLTLGNAKSAIESVWDDLAAENHRGLKTLLRLADQRYVTSTIADPFTLAPVVALTYCTDRDLGQNDRYASMGETIRSLVLAWLRGMARDTHKTDSLRRLVRDRILAAEPERHDEFAVEALATLGPDIDEASEQWLRDTAAQAPGQLDAAVESFAAIYMAQTHPQLLLHLTEAYYIRRPERSRWDRGGLHDDGIRRHSRQTGLGPPFAAWHFGPFYWLLHSLPGDTLDMINRMLDHAAAYRVQTLHQPGPAQDEPDAALGISLDLPGIGSRLFVGDGHVWGWYRGSTVGPYPCMSALLAVERWADSLVAAGIPCEKVVHFFLRSCNNLAMAGLAVGLLIRRLEDVGNLLDIWLTSPAVWSLETSRTSTEGRFRFHAGGADPDEVAGAHRRAMTPREAAAELTQAAMIAGDQQRLDALADVADQLLANARAELGEDPDGQLTRVQGWASLLRSENHLAHRTARDEVVLQYEPPSDLTDSFAPRAAQVAAGSEALRLQHTYGDHDIQPEEWPADSLLADLELARKIAADPPSPFGPLHPQDAPAAVAAAAVISHARGLAVVPDADLRWAADTLLATPTTAPVDSGDETWMVYPMAASGSAARALPSLLLAPFDHLAIAQDRIEQAVTALAAWSDAVRTLLADGCAPAWQSSCEEGADEGIPCRRHQPLWAAVQAALSGCRLGSWRAGNRQPEFLPPPYIDTLPAVPTTDLLVNRLATPIACTTAARHITCLAHQASALLPALMDAHRNGADHWMSEGYAGYNSPERELVVRALITLAADGSTDPLTAHLQSFATNANALQQLLNDAATLCTYAPQLRALLPAVWPLIMTTTLDAGADLRQGSDRWADYAIAALLPTPQPRTADPHFDETLNRVNRDWLAPDALGEAAQRWLDLARGEPMAADAVARFARTTPSTWQRATGLRWLEHVIDGRYDAFANHCWYVIRWLTELRETTLSDAAVLSRWRRIVDGLAASGDPRAVDLQRIDE
ncbi:ATP-binding protein [Streptomyces sp. NPDC005548]|uniref:ATP-binding protein n=1 Tax=Streptomyces sp. NPDC005548 TaxID=3364724 RepID=UPI0036B49058